MRRARPFLLLPFLCAPAAAALAAEPPTDFDDVVWQQAAAADIHVFDAYIGRYRSVTRHSEQQDRDYYYVIEYAWFDPQQTIVRFQVSTVFPDDGSEVVNAQGFYGHDPFNDRLYAYGFFPSGMTGFGGVSEFDRASHRRVTRVRSQDADGVTTEVRDEFRLVDADTWSNQTYISRDGTAWQRVYEDTFTRIGT